MSDLYINAGSFEPRYWTFTDPVTGAPVDLTAPGYAASGVITTSDHTHTVLAVLGASAFSLTAQGRVYLQPHSATTAAWSWPAASYQLELALPGGDILRFDSGALRVSPRLPRA